MTDTTDIKALRELLCHEDLESDYHVGVTVTTLRLLLSKADQLEAERQRADSNEPVRCEGAPQHVHDMIDLQEANEELRAENTALKAKLANPVVPPERKKAEFYVDEEFSNKDLAAIYNCTILELKKKIHAAGFTTVKGE